MAPVARRGPWSGRAETQRLLVPPKCGSRFSSKVGSYAPPGERRGEEQEFLKSRSVWAVIGTFAGRQRNRPAVNQRQWLLLHGVRELQSSGQGRLQGPAPQVLRKRFEDPATIREDPNGLAQEPVIRKLGPRAIDVQLQSLLFLSLPPLPLPSPFLF